MKNINLLQIKQMKITTSSQIHFSELRSYFRELKTALKTSIIVFFLKKGFLVEINQQDLVLH